MRTGGFLKTMALAALAAASIIGSASAQEVTRGPYLQMPTPDAVTVRWRTDVATESTVRFGAAAQILDSTETVTGTRTEH